jgi:hypothetical protein
MFFFFVTFAFYFLKRNDNYESLSIISQEACDDGFNLRGSSRVGVIFFAVVAGRFVSRHG